MKLRKRVFLLAGLAALTTFVIGGTAPIAQGHDPVHHSPSDPVHPGCTWTVDKTAALHSNPSVPISSLTLALGQSVTVDYTIVVERSCETGFNPHGYGSSGDVKDTYPAPGGTTLAVHLFDGNTNLHASQTFRYSRDITGHSCGTFDVVNTAAVYDTVPEPFASDTHTIHVTVNCDTGCTLTQGYWKTHSSYGPASKPDATWLLLPGGLGPDTIFFKSGKKWIDVFWTAPAGNAYYQLAHQYMAAVLNQLNDASVPSSVASAIGSAKTLFETYTPAEVAAMSGSNATRKQFVSLAGTLAAYNEGTTGPGHCDE